MESFLILSDKKFKCLVLFKNRQPTREDIVNIVSRMYEKDGISRKDVVSIVDQFPNQGNIYYLLKSEASLPYHFIIYHST